MGDLLSMGIERLSEVWPDWQVQSLIGEGSFGMVYKAVKEEHGVISNSAIKHITIPQSNTELRALRAEGYDEATSYAYFEGLLADFIREIKMMQSMKGNTNIVNVEDFKVLDKQGVIGWDVFIRMEFLQSFDDWVSTHDLTQADVVKLGLDMANALELCAKKDIIHRDIKPENIFISSFGDFKLGDFGIARELDRTPGNMSMKGTQNYVAPEITRGTIYGKTVDIYSLGLVLYRLLNNNRLPFLDPYTSQIRFQDREDAVSRRLLGESLPSPVNASPKLAQVIMKACAFKPEDRYQNPTELEEALSAIRPNKTKVVLPASNPSITQGTASQDAANGQHAKTIPVVSGKETKPLDQTRLGRPVNKTSTQAEQPQQEVCPRCGNQLDANSDRCPKCGEVLKREPNARPREPKKAVSLIVFVTALFAVIGVALVLFLLQPWSLADNQEHDISVIGSKDRSASAANADGDSGDLAQNSQAQNVKGMSISAGYCYTIGLRSDGTAIALGSNRNGECSTEAWRSVVAVSAGYSHTVGLRSDGTVVAVGLNDQGQCNTEAWRNIVAVSAGYSHTVGLRSDGTVIAVGQNNHGQCNTEDWRSIVAVSAGSSYTVGLCSDGTVVAIGLNDQGQCNIETWRSIVAVSAGSSHTVGLRSDGTVVAIGLNDQGQCNTETWRNIEAVSAGSSHTVGLRSDGTVVAVGSNTDSQRNTEAWRSIVAVSAGYSHTVGLRSDGTVVAVGSNGGGECSVSKWLLTGNTPTAPVVTAPTTNQSNTDYIFPDSNQRYLTREEILALNDWERFIARNEIFARHGRGFNNPELTEYFNSKSWYVRIYSANEYDALPNQLNQYEDRNAALILSIEKELGSPYAK